MGSSLRCPGLRVRTNLARTLLYTLAYTAIKPNTQERVTMGIFIIAITAAITITITTEVDGLRSYRLAQAKGATQEELAQVKFESGAFLTRLW